MYTMLDTISRMRPETEPVQPIRLPRLNRKREYPGAIIERLTRDSYRARIGSLTWLVERAKIVVRLTGRRVRQLARYLVGYKSGVRCEVFLEFLGLPAEVHQREMLHFWLDHLLDHLSIGFLTTVFKTVEYSMQSIGKPAQVVEVTK